MTLPLEGITILDLAPFFPGQLASMLLAEMGAEVIKIERLKMHDAVFEIIHGGISASTEMKNNYRAVNALDRSKKSLSLKLNTETGRKIFYRLAEKADVVIEGSRPGTMKRMSIDYEILRKINKRIIYCSITGYGQDGPYSKMPGRDLSCMAISGVLSIINEGGLPPLVPGVKIADLAGAMYSTIGILLSIQALEKTGKGQFVDISMVDGVLSWIVGALMQFSEKGIDVGKNSIALSGKRPGYNIYKTKDDKYISIALREPVFWEKFCKAVNREDLLPYQNPLSEKMGDIISEIERIFLTRERNDWLDLLKEVCVTKVNCIEELTADPQIAHRKMFIDIETPGIGTFKQIGYPIKLSDTPAEVKGVAPSFGQDTNDILLGLGYSQKEINEFQDAGVLE